MKTKLAVFGPDGSPAEALKWMDASSFDELYEVDIPNDRCLNIFHVEGKYHVPVFDSAYTEMFKYAREYMIHPDDQAVFDELMDPEFLMQRQEESETPGVRSSQFRYRLQNGNWRWVEHFVFSGERFNIPNGVARCYIFDIQNQKDREFGKSIGSNFEQEEQRDNMTRLLREKAFLDTTRSFIAENDTSQWCIIAIDIDHFRLFNDWYGRETGDILLARIGEHLASTEEKTQCIAGYFGHDDFYIVLPFDKEKIDSLHRDLDTIVEELTTAAGFRILFGVAMLEDEIPLYDLIDRALVAVEASRHSIKMDIRLFDQSMLEKTKREYEVVLDFKRAIREREFVVYVQPQCRISSSKIVGAEALARWRKPNGEIIPPIRFIPALEKYGFITDLDLYIWEEVCASLRRWLDAGHEGVPTSVNVSQIDIYSIDVPTCFERLIEKYDIPPELLKIEITESTFADSSSTVENVVQRLHDKGFVVLMDDFGSGYSSLNVLSSLNVDAIKLDAEFLHMDDEGKRKSMHIVESIINMAKTMGLPIITEGVETEDQIEFLDSLGCRYIQGFYYYRPMPLEEFEKIIQNGDKIDLRGFDEKLNDEIRMHEILDEGIYSDAMLNNVLGAVAFYLWREDNGVDIVRFNQKFYRAVGVPEFHDRLVDIQRFVPDNEREQFYDLLARAAQDDLNGAVDTIGFYKPDGSIAYFALHCYYLGDSKEGKRFFTAARDVTELRESQMQMDILSDHLANTIIFMNRTGDSLNFNVVIHGLEDVLGLSQAQVQEELDTRYFFQRVKMDSYDEFKRTSLDCISKNIDFFYPFEIVNARGEVIALRLQADHIKKPQGDLLYIMTLSKLRDICQLNQLHVLDRDS